MCTLSWCHSPGRSGYSLFFNRDERKSREPAEPPAVFEVGGVRILTPRDPRAGGTWLLANEFGLSVALLNHYDADTPSRRPADATSRGRLVLEFGACQDVAAFRALVPQRQKAGRYPAFLLFAIDAAGGESLWRWDGAVLDELDIPELRFLTTSSFRSAEVVAGRCEKRAFWEAGLRALHAQHDSARGEFSIRMRRPDSQTVSRSEIEVDEERVRFLYRPEEIGSLAELPAVDSALPRA